MVVVDTWYCRHRAVQTLGFADTQYCRKVQLQSYITQRILLASAGTVVSYCTLPIVGNSVKSE